MLRVGDLAQRRWKKNRKATNFTLASLHLLHVKSKIDTKHSKQCGNSVIFSFKIGI